VELTKVEIVTLVVPTTFEPEFLEKLTGFPVSSLYGSLSEEPGGRAKKWLPAAGAEQIAEHIDQARARGIDFFYTLNGSCGANREFTAEGQKWLAERLGGSWRWGGGRGGDQSRSSRW
jgi:hypothetical protein